MLGEAWAEDGGRGLIVAPLRGPTQGLLGALTLRWSARHRAGEEELGLAAALAGFAAVAVENARLASDARTARQALTEKNARLLDETQRRGEELRALVRRVGDALAAGHSPERVALPGRRAGPADDPLPPRRLQRAGGEGTRAGRAHCSRWPSRSEDGDGWETRWLAGGRLPVPARRPGAFPPARAGGRGRGRAALPARADGPAPGGRLRPAARPRARARRPDAGAADAVLDGRPLHADAGGVRDRGGAGLAGRRRAGQRPPVPRPGAGRGRADGAARRRPGRARLRRSASCRTSRPPCWSSARART